MKPTPKSKRAAAQEPDVCTHGQVCDARGKRCIINCGKPYRSARRQPRAQAEQRPEAIPIAPVEVVRQALKELLESISECRMDQVTARFAKASVMARAVVDRYKDAT